jgi:hypothetical protein
MRHLSYFMTAAAFATAVATGCSSSSSVGPASEAGLDGPGSTDSPTTKNDGKAPPPGKDSGKEGGMTTSDAPVDSPVKTDSPISMDGGDAGCTFAGFVLDLIKNDTTATATPSTNLGQSCTDDQKQSDFASLF